MTNAHSDTTIDRRDQDWAETLVRLRGFVAARVGDPEIAADITQDVIVRSIASGALDRVDNISAWLYRSARNAVIDHYRTRRTHDEHIELERWPDPDTPDDLPNDATRELARCLQPMMGRLHPTARDALTRVDLEGQTHRQAADSARYLRVRDEVTSAARPTRAQGAARRPAARSTPTAPAPSPTMRPMRARATAPRTTWTARTATATRHIGLRPAADLGAGLR